MGDWADDTLSNDPARDFLIDVLESRDGWDLIDRTLRRALSANDDEIDRQSIAGAELVAAARGFPSAQLSPEDRAFADSVPQDKLAELSALALRAMKHVRSDSSLRLLVLESDCHGWFTSMDDLLKSEGLA